MSYLGRSAKLSLKAQEKVSFLATAGQTVKTGLSYVPSFVEVYVNGVLLTDTTDFTATNGNSITFTVALLLNDEVTVISLKTFTVADHYTKSDADTLLAAKAKLTKKEQEVLGGSFDKQNYRSERIWVTARDGKQIAVSIVRHKDTPFSSETPFLLYAYGSYGHTIDPSFSSTRLSLLDRGFVFAIAHIRGGEYLGRQWYDEGKLLKKKNTFNDFVDCSKFLIEKKYTSPDHLYAQGGSAGGLLMGVIVNMNPELYKGVIADVPFVDVVTTMLDDTIPLTTSEYDEWGNPNNEDSYNYMKSYSPYDNVTAQAYPAMLITTGLHDSQVQYWEPAKWVARLRKLRTNKKEPLLMYCNMETGHGGASGRFESLKETAMEYAFFLDLMGIKS